MSALGGLSGGWSGARRSAAIFGVVLLLTGCAVAPPVQEMSNARQAISAARAAGAARFAPAQIMAAQRWLEDAEYALREKDYGRAYQSARRARKRAIAALGMALRDRPQTKGGGGGTKGGGNT